MGQIGNIRGAHCETFWDKWWCNPMTTICAKIFMGTI